jgi:hypothetical protein
LLHKINSGVESLKAGGVRETIFDVDLQMQMDQPSVPKAAVLLKRAETVGCIGAGPKNIRGESAGGERGWNLAISIIQAVQELTGAIKDIVDNGFTSTACGVSD